MAGAGARGPEECVTIRLDADLTAHFRASGRRWETRLSGACAGAALRRGELTLGPLRWVDAGRPAG
jgi:uncharacterized protein (DUF4415 family)